MMKIKTFNFNKIISTDLKSQTLVLEGDLSIKNAVAIRKVISSQKFSGESVVFHLKNVGKLDITTIQIIQAVRILLNSQGKRTEIISELSPESERLLLNTGFNKTLKIN